MLIWWHETPALLMCMCTEREIIYHWLIWNAWCFAWPNCRTHMIFSKILKSYTFQHLDDKGSISQTVHEFMIEILRNLFHSHLDSDDPISSQLCTCHDSSAVVACVKLWFDLVIFVCIRATLGQNLNHGLKNPLWNESWDIQNGLLFSEELFVWAEVSVGYPVNLIEPSLTLMLWQTPL